MADKETSGMDENKADEKPNNLEDFITHHYEKQKEEGRFDETSEIDNERTENFFSRAIQESRRMNKEIEKSKAKSDKLHNEFGTETMTAWRTEHAAEVNVF
ncbi:hypothetical protein LOTGIDRAFT_238480 [Lottia gigantea]|uniref:Uncharacterized protein n=1 Tax=Lottia gigantea TaxID=225164 RepID=V4AA77_LOTGI|nr:hypothetical protein LOTGIDRAFT_238480 [Lottia gigantea]ESP00854.1 hypothetical protein LOTGIDRAFT_238480 [Lottia gigantea]